ncbi:MAG: pyridoxal-dependent decarboxylase [Candidatus Nanopelagicales bacterium]
MAHENVSELVQQAAEHAVAYLKTVDDRPVMARASFDDMVAAFGGPVPEGPTDPAEVIDRMAVSAEPGLTAMGSGRFFGFVIGGSVPAAQAADVLVGAWEQNVGSNDYTPAVSAMEYVAGRWVLELLGLPSAASVGWVTGGMMANFTGLATGRLNVLAQHGWDVNAQGLQGAPDVYVVVGDERHTTIDLALNFLGLGAGRSHQVPTDEHGVMTVNALRSVLESVPRGAPLIVCLAAGNVNTGAFDPMGACIDVAHDFGAWVHVDGAFGLWAGASSDLRHLVEGVERADSWATDAHKWLNVPYDCGIAITAHQDAHRVAMYSRASYVPMGHAAIPDPSELVPEFSRRARGVPSWAAIASLGRSGVAELVERCCAHARAFAEALGEVDGIDVLNDVVLNQVLVRFGDSDDITRQVTGAIPADGTMLMSGTTFKGRAALRISVCNWRTTDDDVQRCVDVLARLFSEART